MKGHNMIQAVSRVNRVFEDKPHGLIVDYIGIADELREATQTYTQGGGRGEPAPDIGREAKPAFLRCVEAMRTTHPAGVVHAQSLQWLSPALRRPFEDPIARRQCCACPAGLCNGFPRTGEWRCKDRIA